MTTVLVSVPWSTSSYLHIIVLYVLTLLAGVAVGCGQLHVVGGEEAGGSVQLPLPPIRVVLVQNVDQLTFGEAHLVGVGRHVVVYGDHLAHWGRVGAAGVSSAGLSLKPCSGFKGLYLVVAPAWTCRCLTPGFWHEKRRTSPSDAFFRGPAGCCFWTVQ